MPISILYFSYSKLKNKMAAKISENVTTLHDGLAHNEHKHIISVSTITFLGQEFSYDVSEGHIATTFKQWHLITRLLVTHKIVAPKY